MRRKILHRRALYLVVTSASTCDKYFSPFCDVQEVNICRSVDFLNCSGLSDVTLNIHATGKKMIIFFNEHSVIIRDLRG